MNDTGKQYFLNMIPFYKSLRKTAIRSDETGIPELYINTQCFKERLKIRELWHYEKYT